MASPLSHPLHKLGNSDLQLTPIGFGAWAIGGGNWQFGWGPQDDNDSIAAIRAAFAELITSPRLRNEGIKIARRFTWSEVAQKYSAIYREVLGR